MFKREPNGLYVGCGLTNAPPAFKESVADLKQTLKQTGYNVLEFIGEEDGSPESVYVHDIKECVGKAALMLAIVDQPSLGLGWEMSSAGQPVEAPAPTLAVAAVGSLVTRLVLGAADHLEHFEMQRYSDLSEVPDHLENFIKNQQNPIEARRCYLMNQQARQHQQDGQMSLALV